MELPRYQLKKIKKKNSDPGPSQVFWKTNHQSSGTYFSLDQLFFLKGIQRKMKRTADQIAGSSAPTAIKRATSDADTLEVSSF